MDKKTTLEMIAAISNANGTSGFRDEVVAADRPYAEGLGELQKIACATYISAVKKITVKENNQTLFSSAHSDELALWCRLSALNGTLRIIQIGVG